MSKEIKSTLDLVMERFKTEEDVAQLTDEQKQEIASIRKHYEAKIAEARILLSFQAGYLYRKLLLIG